MLAMTGTVRATTEERGSVGGLGHWPCGGESSPIWFSGRLHQVDSACELRGVCYVPECQAYRELDLACHGLLCQAPADPKPLVDLLPYMDKNSSTFPQEIVGRS